MCMLQPCSRVAVERVGVMDVEETRYEKARKCKELS